MKKWLAKLFNDAVSGEPPVTANAPVVAPPATADAAHRAEVDAVFYRWLANAGDYDAPHTKENLILSELARMADTPSAGASLVPRVPAVIPQLLRSLRDDSISGADLARQVSHDVVLVAEVIREANSPYYRPATPIKTIEAAVMLLGQSGLRMLLARVAFRPIISMQTGQFARLMAPAVWRQSEQCARAASLLAPAARANPFEAYLAGLMHNVGLIVAFRVIDRIYFEPRLPQSDAFCAGLVASARILSARIGELWDFPASVTGAIEAAGAPASTLAHTLARSDCVSKLRMLVDAGQFKADDPFIEQDLDPALRACFDKLHIEED